MEEITPLNKPLVPTDTPTAAPEPSWPIAKKNNKWKPILGGLLAILLVAGASFGAFYITRNLNQAAVPTAPKSNPFASVGCLTNAGKSKCSASETCVNDVCKSKAIVNPAPTTYVCNATNCPAPNFKCSSSTNCVSTTSPGTTVANDSNNCGATGNKCSAGLACENGKCVAPTNQLKACGSGLACQQLPLTGGTYCYSGTTLINCCNAGYSISSNAECVSPAGAISTPPPAPTKAPSCTAPGQQSTCGAGYTCSSTGTCIPVAAPGTIYCVAGQDCSDINIPLGSTKCTRPNGGMVTNCCPKGVVISGTVPNLSCGTPSGGTTTGVASTTKAPTPTASASRAPTAACVDSTWTPATNTVCTGASFTQTSNCGKTRTSTGILDPVMTTSTVKQVTCNENGVVGGLKTFSYTCNAPIPAGGRTSPYVITKTLCTDQAAIRAEATANCRTLLSCPVAACTATSWTPDPATICQYRTFEQTSNCGTTRTVSGTDTTNVLSPAANTICKGVAFTQTNSCSRTREIIASVGTKTDGACATACVASTWSPAASTVCSGTNLTQTSNCGTTRTVAGTKTTGTCVVCTDTTWTPAASTACEGVSLTQTSNCGITRTVAGTKTDGACLACVDTTWTPAASTKCKDISFIQTSNCGETRDSVGTKTTGSCAIACVDTTWSPEANTACAGSTLTQTSNCGTDRIADGTKECGSPFISMTKKVFSDESGNTPGNYTLVDEIDTVSKDQVVVFSFEVFNDGTAKAENIVVTDTLKEDNRELLTLVDAESRCKYTTSTRKITCSGMNLDADKSDTYSFRVKVANGAVNGETIKNIGSLTYLDMPVDGGVDADVELSISTVVGCNNTCTSDNECLAGLSCDPDTSKCRKPSCSEASSCNCPVVTEEPTPRPTRAVTVRVTRAPTVYVARAVEPTVLPETGILDFPGIATFGGGLLLAIVGILLAL